MPELTPEDAGVLAKGIDFDVFVEDICGIRLNKAQQRIARRLILDSERQWDFKTGHVVAANQIGKTLITACLILWACMYKVGVYPPRSEAEYKAWMAESYLWLHLAPVQQQAYLAFADAKRIIKNEHPAQGGRGKFPTVSVEVSKVEKYYDGLVFWNGAEAHFRTGEHKAEAVLGYRAAGVSIDEAAFLDHLAVTVNEVLYMRLIAARGPLFMISTPNGMNDFFDFVDEVKTGGERVEDKVWVLNDKWLVWAFIDDNLGYGLSASEIDRMEITISEATKEQQLRGAFLEPQAAFFVPQAKIIEAFDMNMPEEQKPIPGHLYAEFWDPSVSSDPTAVIVLDVTNSPWEGVYHRCWVKPMDVTQLIGEMHKIHRYYHGFKDDNYLSVPSRSVMGFDATSMGGAIFKKLLASLSPKQPVNFGGNATKVPGLMNLRDLMTRGELRLPATGSWVAVRHEVLNYKLKDDKIRQDNVMALMGAGIIANTMTANKRTQKVDVGARITRKKRLIWR